MHYCYNDNFAETLVDELNPALKGRGLDAKLAAKALATFKYYHAHLAGLTAGNRVYLLTENSNTKRLYEQLDPSSKPFVLDVADFISAHQGQFPELSNFLGFHGELGEEAELAGEGQLFEAHLDFEELVLGVKAGRFFQGRLNVSRMTATEAVVKVQGLTNDILLTGLEQQNRALNGDIVCIEIDSEDKWIDNYKAAEPHNALLEDEQKVEKVKLKLHANGDADSRSDGSMSEDEPANINMIELINSETKRQVTGRVRGILKKLNKTYGGSLIATSDMLVSTLNKFKVFCENHNIPESEQDKYRVFVPYNVQMPQAIIKASNPEALSNKRMIVRYADWKVSSPFPIGQFVKIIGEEGKIGTETNMILHEFNVDTRPFS